MSRLQRAFAPCFISPPFWRTVPLFILCKRQPLLYFCFIFLSPTTSFTSSSFSHQNQTVKNLLWPCSGTHPWPKPEWVWQSLVSLCRPARQLHCFFFDIIVNRCPTRKQTEWVCAAAESVRAETVTPPFILWLSVSSWDKVNLQFPRRHWLRMNTAAWRAHYGPPNV